MTIHCVTLYSHITYVHAVIELAYYPLLGGHAKLSSYLLKSYNLIASYLIFIKVTISLQDICLINPIYWEA